jgi:PEP-CTERM motif
MKAFNKYVTVAALAIMPVIASAFPIAISGTEGLGVFVTGTDDIIATYQGNSASYSNDLYLTLTASSVPAGTFVFNNHTSPVGATMNLGSFAIGTELIFRLHVNNTGADYYTGAASRNADNHTHARVESEWQTNESLVSFEDLFNGPFDYNDLSFSFTNTTSAPAVPEPASVALFSFGLLGLGLLKRKLSK